MAESRRTRILILGGGFGGVYTAMRLEKLLRGDPGVEVGLVSKENYLVFQPMLPEVVSGSIGILDTITPIRRLCPRTNLYNRAVETINLEERLVTTSSGFRPRPYTLHYDHLVIALGTITSFAGQPGLQEHALPFKYLGDALALRNRVIHALEEADIEKDPEIRRALLTFVVAGGGFSGVEAVAEVNDFVRGIARNFRNIDRSELKVILLHSRDLILPELPEPLARFAQRLLQRRGVEIRFNSRLAEATADYAILKNGDRIPTKTLVSTVPSAAHPLVAELPIERDRGGRIVVDQHLQVKGFDGVWALGDCAAVPDGTTGEMCPPTAQHAIRQGVCVADNIVAQIRNQPRRSFAFKTVGKLAGLGQRSAVAEIFGIKMSGILAWFMWRAIYWMKMPGLDRKVRVAVDWFLDFFLHPDIVQLKTEQAPGVRREHFDKGEIVFREGDRGDRLYIIVEGEVDVVRADAGDRETHLATLGPGACFGEVALVEDRPRNATVRSRSSLNVLTVDRPAFEQLFAHLPPLRSMFQQMIDERSQRSSAPAVTPASDRTG